MDLRSLQELLGAGSETGKGGKLTSFAATLQHQLPSEPDKLSALVVAFLLQQEATYIKGSMDIARLCVPREGAPTRPHAAAGSAPATNGTRGTLPATGHAGHRTRSD